MLRNCLTCFERLNLMAPRNHRDAFENHSVRRGENLPRIP